MINLNDLNLEELKKEIKADYVSIKFSLLGGIARPSLIIWLSLDKKETWTNDIFQNSRYYIFNIDYTGRIEIFSKGHNTKKIRAKNIKSISEAIDYINKKI